MKIAPNSPELDAGSAPQAPQIGIIGRVLRGTGAMSLGAVVNIGSQLLVVPAAIAAWGAGKYGEWIVISGAVTVFQLADLGVQTYVVNSICTSFARGNLIQFHETLRDALAVQTRIVLTLISAIWALLWFAPVNRWLNLHTVDQRTNALALAMLSADLLMNIPLGVIGGIYRATGRMARNAMMGVVQRSATLFLTVGLLYLNQGFIALASARLCVTLGGVAWLMFDFPRLYPWLRIRIAGADIRRGFAMLMPGMLFLLIPAADYATNQISLIIAQHQLSGLEVARLATHRTIFNSAQMAANFLLLAIWPELTMLHARADRERLQKVHGTLTKVNVFAVLLVAATMLLVSQWLYPLWTRKTLQFDTILAGILAARTLCWAYWGVSSMMLMAMNRPALVAWPVATGALISTVLALALIPWIGIRGAPLASLIADLSVSIWLIPKSAAMMVGGSYRAFLFGPTRAVAAAILIPALLFWLAFISGSSDWQTRFAITAAAALTFVFGTMLAFGRSEKATFLAVLRRMLRLPASVEAVAASNSQ